MTETGYPKAIGFKCHNPEGLTADAQEWLSRLRNEVTITMLAENIIQIKYPSDIVELVKTVNVDDTIYRLDFIAPDDRFGMCNCVFPDVPWNNHDFMQNRWGKGLRVESKGVLFIEYPKKQQE